MKLWWKIVEWVEQFWFTRLFPPLTELRFEFPNDVGRVRELRMFKRIGTRRGDDGPADFSPEVKSWCKLNLKKGYSVRGIWDTSTFVNEYGIELTPCFVVRFKSESDALLFKVKWT